jgi:hypothetical protein
MSEDIFESWDIEERGGWDEFDADEDEVDDRDPRVQELTRTIRAKIVMCPGCDCWIWTGFVDRDGYGQFKFKGKVLYTHRYVYEKFNRKIKAGLTLDHLSCTSHACVNPDHLQQVTRSTNAKRGNDTRWRGLKYDDQGKTFEHQPCAACLERLANNKENQHGDKNGQDDVGARPVARRARRPDVD